MLSILRKKQQIIHYIVEIIVIGFIFFYFTQKHKKLQTQIRQLFERVESQETMLESHEKLLKKLLDEKKILII